MRKKLLFLMVYLCFTALLSRKANGQDIATLKEQKPVTFHGSIGLNLMGYAVSGIPERQKPFSFVLSANATLSIYGIELPFSFALSDKQRNYSQPFNQFGVSPHWKWITLHAGYRNLTFSSYTLAGHTFLGGGIELNPGIFRFGFVYGRFDRKTSTSPVNSTDSLPGFTRKGFAVRIGVGSEKNFFDLLFLRIRDDSTTLEQPDTSRIRTPEQNVISGIHFFFTLFKGFTWESEAAFSLLTSNLGAEALSDIEDNSFLHSMNRFLVINQSSTYSTALRSAIHYKGKGYTLKLEYKRIDPNYQSMGAYYFNNDIENLTFSPSFGLFKRKVTIAGGIGLQRDNLRKTKKATSLRTIGNISLSVNPSSTFGIDISYSNYSINQRAGRLPLSDTLKVVQSNQVLTLSPRLLFVNETFSHILTGSYTYMRFTDRNKFTSGSSQFNSHTALLTYVLGLNQSKWSFIWGLNFTQVGTFAGTSQGYGGSFSISKVLLDDHLTLNWNNALTRSTGPQANANILNSGILGSYQVNRHHAFRLNLYYNGVYNDPGSINPSFNEFKGDLSYVFTF